MSNSLPGWATYEAATPGVDGGGNATVRLDLDNEPQPDALLLIDPARGGQARISADDYVEQAPELVAEVAASSASYDLHTKLERLPPQWRPRIPGLARPRPAVRLVRAAFGSISAAASGRGGHR